MTARRLRLWLSAILLAGAIIAWTVRELRAQDDGDCEGSDPGEYCAVIYYPGICAVLSPSSIWYDIFLCADENLLMAATEDPTRRVVNVVDFGDFLFIQIEIDVPDGSVRQENHLLSARGQRVRVIREVGR